MWLCNGSYMWLTLDVIGNICTGSDLSGLLPIHFSSTFMYLYLSLSVCVSAGNKSAFALSHPLGRQSFHFGRNPNVDLSTVSHLRPLHAQCFYSGARLLRTPGRLPRQVSSRREGTRQVNMCLQLFVIRWSPFHQLIVV